MPVKKGCWKLYLPRYLKRITDPQLWGVDCKSTPAKQLCKKSPCSSGYAQKLATASADLQSALFSKGFVILQTIPRWRGFVIRDTRPERCIFSRAADYTCEKGMLEIIFA